MKSFVIPKKKLSNRETFLLATIGFLGFLLVLASMMILVLRSTGIKLSTQNENLNGKVSSLQGDLKDIGERLSGLSDTPAEGEDKPAEVLSRIGLIATPGETQLNVDTPKGWELIGENRLKSGESTVVVQSEDIDLLTISNYAVTRVVESVQLKSGQSAFLVFIKTSADNKGYLSLSFCNPDTGAACSFKGDDGKFVFVLAHGVKEGDQFVRDMDFNSVEGIKLLTDFKIMVKSLEIN